MGALYRATHMLLPHHLAVLLHKWLEVMSEAALTLDLLERQIAGRETGMSCYHAEHFGPDERYHKRSTRDRIFEWPGRPRPPRLPP